jgi:autotransporter-associated beta strand protein
MGPNTLTLTAANLYPSRTTVACGTLKIDAGAGASLFNTSALTFAGTGTFNYDNTGAVGTTSQTLGALTVVAASANNNTTAVTEATVQLTRAAAQTTNLKFASLAARVAGGTLNFKVAGTPGTNGTDSKIWFASGPTASVFLDQGTFFDGSAYAAYDATGYLRAMNYASDNASGGASVGSATDFTAAGANGKHVDLTGSISGAITESIKSLRIGGTNGVTLGAGNTLTLANGGILKTGGGTSTITGGTGLSATGSPLLDLVIRTDGSTDKLIITSPILLNTVTKSGDGTLELGGANTFTSLRINAGRLNLTTPSNIPATATLTIGDGTTLDNTSGANLTVGGGGLTTRIGGSFTYLGSTGDLTLGTDGAFNSLPNDSTITVAANTLKIVKELVTYSTAAVTKNGPGTLGFAGNGQHKFVGGLTINNGVVAGGPNDNANQTAGLGPVTLGDTNGVNPATLYLANNQDNSSPLTVRAGSSGTLALVSESGKAPRWDGPVTLNNALTLASINGTSGTLHLYSVISGGSGLNIGNTGSIVISSATKTLVNQGIVKLWRANPYTGNTLVNSGTLALGALASIDSTPLISLAAGATLDVSAIDAYTLSGTNTLAAKGTGTTTGTTAARINGASGGTVSLSTRPVSLTWGGASSGTDTTHPSLVVSQGSLTLSGNTISVVNNGTPLGAGVYTLIKTPGAITGVPNTALVSVTGTGGLAANSEAFATVSGNEVILTVNEKLEASFSGLTLNQTIQTGTANVTLSGMVSAPGPTYPADGETVHVTINGVTNDTTTSGGTGSFSLVFPTSGIPGNVTPYTITYTYDGSMTLDDKTDTSTELTVTTQQVPTIISWPTTAGLTYGDTLTVATLTGGSASVPGIFTYTAPSTIPGAAGSYAASGTFTPTNTVTYSTVTVPGMISVPVSQKELTIASPAVTTRGYNAANDAAITGTLTGVLAGDVGSVSFVGTGAFDTAFPNVDIGVTAACTLSGEKEANYFLTQPVSLTGTITAATLTVMADNKSRAAGAANPTLTSTVTGYQGGDNAGSVSLTGTPVLATAATPASPVGIYPITCAAGDVTIMDPNYTLNFVDGALEVVGLATWAKGSGAWDIATSVNWTNPTLNPVTYLDGGEVLFPDTTGFGVAPFTVTLSTTVNPASITVNNPNRDYIFSGSGTIAGATSLTKQGAGALTLGTANTYSGGTTVGACTLTLASQTGFGTGPVTLAAGTTFQQDGFEGNAVAGAVPNALVLSGTGFVTVNMPFGQKDIWLSQAVTGTGGFTVQGGGRSLTLTADNSFSGGVTLQNYNNRIQISHVNALGTGAFRSETTTANSGQLIPLTDLSADPGVANAVDIASGAYLNVSADGSNHLKLSGAITSAVGKGNLYKDGSATLTLTGTNTYSGNTTVGAGTLNLAADGQLKFVLGATSGVSNSISGEGTAVLDGNFLIDTTAAAALSDGTWTLENVPLLTGIYGSTFTVVGFTADVDDDTWTKTASGKTWTFVESTGVLTLTSASVSDYDAWALTYLPGADVSNPAADTDGDGLSNQQEYAFGLNPTLGSSANPITAQLNKTTGMFSYTRRATPATSGFTYTVLTSTGLVTWAPDATAVQTVTGTANGVETVQVTVTGAPLTAPKFFVRVQAVPAP